MEYVLIDNCIAYKFNNNGGICVTSQRLYKKLHGTCPASPTINLGNRLLNSLLLQNIQNHNLKLDDLKYLCDVDLDKIILQKIIENKIKLTDIF